jgi:hypothetical protein
MTTPTIATNPVTGVEYYADGPLDGQSVKLYVAVTDGQVRNPNGVRWPFTNGSVHDQAADFYEIVPFAPVPFDPELFRVDDENSGWALIPTPGALPGHPQGTYEKTEVIIRRSKAELRQLVQGYAARAHGELWPQEPGYDQKVAYADKEIAKGSQAQHFFDLIARHEQLIAASFANDARRDQLYAEIEAAGETGPVDFIVSEGWINGIEP